MIIDGLTYFDALTMKKREETFFSVGFGFL